MKSFCKEFKTGIDKKTIQELEKLSFEDFLPAAQKYIYKQLGVPENLHCSIQVMELPRKVGMAYSYDRNMMFVNLNAKQYRFFPSQAFSALRHEILHQKQWYNLLRTEELGDKAVEFMTQLHTKGLIKNVKKTSLEELEKQKDALGELYSILEKFKLAKTKESEAEYLKILTDIVYKDLIEEYRLLQKQVTDSFGVISKDSKEAEITKLYFDEIRGNVGELKANVRTRMEIEAYSAGFVAQIEYLFAKWFNKK